MFEDPNPPSPAARFWIKLLRVSVLALLLLFTSLIYRAATAEVRLDFLYVIAGPLVLVFAGLLVALRSDAPSGGALAFAISFCGSCSLLCAAALLFVLGAAARESPPWVDLFWAGTLLAFGTAATAAFRLLRWRRELGWSLGPTWPGGILGAVCFVLCLTLLVSVLSREQWPAGQARAVECLRQIHSAQQSYATGHKRSFSATLAALGPAAAKAAPSEEAADLVDEYLARGAKYGYRFEYTPGPRDAEGRITQYVLTARPNSYQRGSLRSFYSDQTGVICSTAQDRPATKDDPALN